MNANKPVLILIMLFLLEANQAAYYLAKFVITILSDFTWIEEILECVWPNFFEV